jgi:hypothetical protein
MLYHPLVGRRAIFGTTRPLRAAGLRSARQGIIGGVAEENADGTIGGGHIHTLKNMRTVIKRLRS